MTKRILTAFAVAATALAVFTACNSGSDLKPSADGGVKKSKVEYLTSEDGEEQAFFEDIIFLEDLMEYYGDNLVEAPDFYQPKGITTNSGEKIFGDDIYVIMDGDSIVSEVNSFRHIVTYQNAVSQCTCDKIHWLADASTGAKEDCRHDGSACCVEDGHIYVCSE